MRLRTVGIVLALAVLATTIAADAQPAGKVWRVGYLGTTPQPYDDDFRRGLRELGYVDGQNIIVEYRWGKGVEPGKYRGLAEELIRLKVDAIVAVGSPATRAAREATSEVPIVMTAVGDPIAYGFVPSLAQPGGNITGLSSAISQTIAKGLQLIKEVVPDATRAVFLLNPANPGAAATGRVLDSAASLLNVRLEIRYVSTPAELDAAFGMMTSDPPNVLIVSPDHFLFTQRTQIVDFATVKKLPAVYFLRPYASIGGLIVLGPDRREMYRRAAGYVDKILKGAKPGDLPVEQPTKFELVINLKTAKALGLTIPPSLLLRADQVID